VSLEDFYFVSQIIATGLLFASLIFVGIQIQQNTKATRASSAFEVARMWGEYNLSISASAERAYFLRKILNPSITIDEFSDEEIAKADMFVLGLVQFHMAQFRLYQQGSLPAEDWELQGKWAAHFRRLPAGKRFYDDAMASGHYMHSFVVELDRLDALVSEDAVFRSEYEPKPTSETVGPRGDA